MLSICVCRVYISCLRGRVEIKYEIMPLNKTVDQVLDTLDQVDTVEARRDRNWNKERRRENKHDRSENLMVNVHEGSNLAMASNLKAMSCNLMVMASIQVAATSFKARAFKWLILRHLENKILCVSACGLGCRDLWDGLGTSQCQVCRGGAYFCGATGRLQVLDVCSHFSRRLVRV